MTTIDGAIGSRDLCVIYRLESISSTFVNLEKVGK